MAPTLHFGGGVAGSTDTAATVSAHLRKPQDDLRDLAILPAGLADRARTVGDPSVTQLPHSVSALVTERSGSLRGDRRALYREPHGQPARAEDGSMGEAVMTTRRQADGAIVVDVRGTLDAATVDALRGALVGTLHAERPGHDDRRPDLRDLHGLDGRRRPGRRPQRGPRDRAPASCCATPASSCTASCGSPASPTCSACRRPRRARRPTPRRSWPRRRAAG